jgi:hypothetical protein
VAERQSGRIDRPRSRSPVDGLRFERALAIHHSSRRRPWQRASFRVSDGLFQAALAGARAARRGSTLVTGIRADGGPNRR